MRVPMQIRLVNESPSYPPRRFGEPQPVSKKRGNLGVNWLKPFDNPCQILRGILGKWGHFIFIFAITAATKSAQAHGGLAPSRVALTSFC